MGTIGNKVKERWYPKYAPHIILGTNISILDTFKKKKRNKKYGTKN